MRSGMRGENLAHGQQGRPYTMKVTTWVSAIALAGAATLAGSPVWAAAGDNCVKILGYE